MDPTEITAEYCVRLANNGTNITLYGYDRAGQLTNEVLFTNGMVGFRTNAWQYDEAGNWLHSPGENRWRLYNQDNELLGICGSNAPVSVTTTVTGHVEPGPASNKWFNTWATVRGETARVGTNTGNFSIANGPIYPGANDLEVTVRDISANTATQTRSVRRPMEETSHYDGNGNLTNWVSGTTNWVYEWDWADRLAKVSSNGITVLENWYEAGSRRLVKKDAASALYLWDGWESVAVLNQSGVAQEIFTRGVGIAGDIGTLVAITKLSTPAIYYAHHNHRGDVTTVRNGANTVSGYSYSAFGLQTSAFAPTFAASSLSSKEREPLRLSYYGYRFYAPQWQRWTSRDPLAAQHMVKEYEFLGNSFPNYIDAEGLMGDGISEGMYWFSVNVSFGVEA